MSDEFIPYGKQWIDEDDLEAVTKVLRSDFLTQGPALEEFEKKIADMVGARYCVAVCNATAGLHLAVAALEIEGGKEGITSPNTFLASANCLAYNNLTPRFADIDPDTYNINPQALEKSINPKTRVIVPVHFAGQPADMKSIKKLADKNGLKVIEDAAHAIGSTDEEGQLVGSCRYSDMTVFSFHPVKTITTGEGGAITTNSLEIAKKLRILRSHGVVRGPDLTEPHPGPWYYEMVNLGFNYRLTDLQAALGTSQLMKLESFKQRRREIVQEYNAAFSSLQGVFVPFERPGVSSCFHLYVLKVDFPSLGKDRVQVMRELRDRGIGTQVHYIPVHTQPYYQETWGYRAGDFPVAEAYYEQALSLPLYPKMNSEEVQRVKMAVLEVLGSK